MFAPNQFYKIVKLPLDEIFLSIIFQSVIVTEWLAFKKLFFSDRHRLSGTLIGLVVFVSLLLFCHESQRAKTFHTLKKLFPHVNWPAPTLADAIRFIIQTLWLTTVQTKTAYDVFLSYFSRICRLLIIIKHIAFWPFTRTSKAAGLILNEVKRLHEHYNVKFEPYIYVLVIFLLTSACITIPLTPSAQIAFIFLLGFVVMTARSIAGYLPKLVLVILSVVVSSRYLWWRYTSTLNIDSNVDIFLGVILICAETYIWLVLLLGFLQIVWPLQRKPIALPADPQLWPSVDIFIPTYHEDINIVKTTTLAALSIDWPEDKLNVFILDDGKRSLVQEFAAQINVGYISRDNDLHAKAGNINHALTVTKGDYVAIFNCGHIPARSFLQLTMGWFLKDKKLALIQTPHCFYSPDSFGRNLDSLKTTLNENSPFYDRAQDDDDLWNTAFFNGSCAVLKRAPLLEAGGIAVETDAENAHTALRLHRKGYTSAYINEIQAAGLIPETLSAHIGQRIRWARGMAQILRTDNPLSATGLNMAQRLHYANIMLHFLSGVPYLIFLLAPLGFLFFHRYLIDAPAVEIVLYAFPVIVLSNMACSYRPGERCYSFWAGLYKAVLSWHISYPTAIALINPKKRGLIETEICDLSLSKPYLCLIALNLSAAVFAVVRYLSGPADEQAMVLLNLAWAAGNLMLLGMAISVTQEPKRMRLQHRFEANTEVVIKKASGHLICAVMEDYSDSGLGLRIDARLATIEKNEKVHVVIPRSDQEFVFPGRVITANQGCFDVLFENLTPQQQLDYIQCTYACSDTWLSSRQNFSQEKPLSSAKTIIMVSLYGYIVLARALPKFITRHFLLLGTSMAFIKTLLPKNIKDNSIQHEHA